MAIYDDKINAVNEDTVATDVRSTKVLYFGEDAMDAFYIRKHENDRRVILSFFKDSGEDLSDDELLDTAPVMIVFEDSDSFFAFAYELIGAIKNYARHMMLLGL